MKLPPETIDKRWWGIGELAIKFNVSTSLIRYYCDFFGIQPVRAHYSNNRRFTQQDVDKLSQIFSYVKEGYKLKAIKNKI